MYFSDLKHYLRQKSLPDRYCKFLEISLCLHTQSAKQRAGKTAPSNFTSTNYAFRQIMQFLETLIYCQVKNF